MGHAIEELNSFKQYLERDYNPTTCYNYFMLFKRTFIHTQNDVDSFVIEYTDHESGTINPLYSGFLGCYISFLNTGLTIPKNKRKGKGLVLKDYQFLTKDDVDYIIRRTKHKTSVIVQLMFETGLRLTETFKVTSHRINMDSKTIKGYGKGNKPFVVRFSDNMKGRLKEYIEHKSEDSNLIFRNLRIENSKRQFQYNLTKECKELGIIMKVTPHKIRHALGNYMINIGFSLDEVQVKLRHSNISTTQIYARTDSEKVDSKFFELID